MKIYPAIDLIDGQSVRLEQGRFDSSTVYSQDPASIARRYAEEGATYLHVVDLDGAKAREVRQSDLILDIAAQSGLKVQTGGGIRTSQQISTLLEGGVDRVIVGSLAVREPEAVRGFLSEYGGERITLAQDERLNEQGTPMTATEGWLDGGNATLWDVMDFYKGCDLQTLLCTDIGRDGMFTGPNLPLYEQILTRYPNVELMASGGIASVDDLAQVKTIGCGAVIIGKALSEGRFTLKEALHAR